MIGAHGSYERLEVPCYSLLRTQDYLLVRDTVGGDVSMQKLTLQHFISHFRLLIHILI
jgi:hypothetical protein